MGSSCNISPTALNVALMNKNSILVSYNGRMWEFNKQIAIAALASCVILICFFMLGIFIFFQYSGDIEKLKKQLMVERTINSTLSREIHKSNEGITKIAESVTGNSRSNNNLLPQQNIKNKIQLYGILKSMHTHLNSIDAYTTKRAEKLRSVINVAKVNNNEIVRQGIALINMSESVSSKKIPSNIQKAGMRYQASMTSLISETIERITSKQSGVDILQEFISSMPLERPLIDGRFVSGFGVRSHPIYHREKMHYGVDFVGGFRAKIIATGDGIVERALYSPSYGNYVIIKHKHNIRTLYAHMNTIKVKPGQKVKAGQTVGIQGSTGNSTGAHVHYEMLINGVHVDPLNFIRAKSLL